ncbi:MAG TPA: hypothetical protein VIR58_13650 [Acidimicrobiales bacterium]
MEEAVAIDSTELEIVVPADARLLRVLRLVASGVASLGSLSLDAVEEVRVAVDELGATLIGASNGAPLTVRFQLDADQLCVEGSTEVRSSGMEVDPLTDRILDAVATSHEWTTADGVASCRIEKDLASVI